MKRPTSERDRNRTDLLAALVEAEERPIRADALVAASHGTTVRDCPDGLWWELWRHGVTDLRALARARRLIIDRRTHTYDVWTDDLVDLPGGVILDRRDMAEDVADTHRMFAEWQAAE